MAAAREPEDGYQAIMVSEEGPELVRIRPVDGRLCVLVPEAKQPSAAKLNAMIEAQGGNHNPGGIFRYDPALARSGIRCCPNCGRFWISRSDDPKFVPVRCSECQRPLRRKA